MTAIGKDKTEDVLTLLKQHIADFKNHEKEVYEFIERNDEHLQRARTAIEEVGELHNAITAYVPNLSQLGSIASTLRSMEEAVLKQNSDLIFPATTAEKMPTRVAIVMLGICFIMLLILGSALILVLIRDSNKNLSIGGKDGLHITDNRPNQKAAEAPPESETH